MEPYRSQFIVLKQIVEHIPANLVRIWQKNTGLTSKECPRPLRLIVVIVKVEVKDTVMSFLTNNFK